MGSVGSSTIEPYREHSRTKEVPKTEENDAPRRTQLRWTERQITALTARHSQHGTHIWFLTTVAAVPMREAQWARAADAFS